MVEYGRHLVGNLTCVIENVVAIDCQNIAFSGIYSIEIFSLNILLNLLVAFLQLPYRDGKRP